MFMGIIGYDDLAEYISLHYSQGSRIVEVGIGRHPDVALLLNDQYDLICTDVADILPENLCYVQDNIFNPNVDLYRGASLIYSIRPPVDMQDSIASIGKMVGADLIIRPFSSERTDLSRYYEYSRCVNYKKATFFLYSNRM